MMVAQGGLMSMSAVDVFVIGRVSALALGGVALGNTICGVVIVLGVGISMGIEPLVSQAHGANDRAATRAWLWQGWWVAAAAAVPLMVTAYVFSAALPLFGVSEALAAEATVYVVGRLAGIGASCLYTTARGYFSSLEHTRPVVIAVVAANVLNLAADLVLVYVFDLGSAGIAWATSLCFTFMALVLARAARVSWRNRARPDITKMRRIVELGWPIGTQLMAETGIFALFGVLIARFGDEAIGGHQVALTWTSIVFMCALGLAAGATTRVGMHVGAGRTDMARRAGFLAIGLGALWMSVWAVAFVVFRTELSSVIAPGQDDVVAVAKGLIVIGGFFAISDGVQAVAAGALRGAGDTKWPFYANVASHWAIAVPMGWWLAEVRGMGPAGYWWALSIGLTLVGVILVGRFWVLSRREIQAV